jgi:hypothetical protein
MLISQLPATRSYKSLTMPTNGMGGYAEKLRAHLIFRTPWSYKKTIVAALDDAEEVTSASGGRMRTGTSSCP